MWNSTNFVESVTERDMDLLILEELVCCRDFRNWFLQSVLLVDEETAFLGALHSISNELGESDLAVGFRRADGHEFAILVENKIDADFQPDQAERYHKRGTKGITSGHWQSFVTCIIAPQSYLTGAACADEFHHSCAYEALENWFRSRIEKSDRAQFKAQLLRYAIAKSRRKQPKVIASEVSVFWQCYWRMLTEQFAALHLDQPGEKGPKADWPTIRSSELPARTFILHKWAEGFVDLQVSGAAGRVDEFRRLVAPLLPADIVIAVTGQSLALRIVVPFLNRWQPFNTQAEHAQRGLAAATRLVRFGSQILRESGGLIESRP